MVIYRTSDGTSNFEQADAIDEAALFVERLRNKEGIDQIRIYRMEEISFAFRPYYKVELGPTDRQGTPTTPPARKVSAADAPPVAPEAAVEAAVEVEVPPMSTDTAPDARPAPLERRHVDAPLPQPPMPEDEGEHAGANGRRGLFGR
jgi:hypothetical protein